MTDQIFGIVTYSLVWEKFTELLSPHTDSPKLHNFLLRCCFSSVLCHDLLVLLRRRLVMSLAIRPRWLLDLYLFHLFLHTFLASHINASYINQLLQTHLPIDLSPSLTLPLRHTNTPEQDIHFLKREPFSFGDVKPDE